MSIQSAGILPDKMLINQNMKGEIKMNTRLRIDDLRLRNLLVSVTVIFLLTTKLCFGITADEVIENYFKALGGKDRLKNFKSIYFKTKVTGDTEVNSITWADSRYFKTETYLGGCTVFECANGANEKGAWEATSQGVIRYLEGQELKESAIPKISSNFILHMIEEKGFEKKYIGEKQEGGKKYHLVEIKMKDSPPVTLFFNEKTWLIDKEKYGSLLKNDGFTFSSTPSTTTDYLEYKTINGILFPYHLKISSKISTIEVTNYDIVINPSLDANIFEPPKYKSNLVIKDNKKNAVIPFIKGPEGYICLKVKINDSPKEYNFLLDSGSSCSFISSSVASELKLELIGKGMSTGISAVIGNKESEPARHAKIKALHLEGGVDITDCFMTTLSQHDIDGLLGYDFISQMILEIDNKNSTLICHKPDNFVPPAGAAKVPLKLAYRMPFIDALINEKEKTTLFIDTGFQTGFEDIKICLLSGFTEKADIKTTEGKQFNSGAGIVTIKFAEIESIRLDKYLLPGGTSLVAVVKVNMEVDGVLGSGFFSRFQSVIFDYCNKTLWVVSRMAIGAIFQAEQELAIASACPCSPAEKAGLKNGDIILQCDKKEVNSRSQLISLLENYKSGDKITLLIQRDKEKIEKELILQPMYYTEKK